jgi:hypothetical protein
MGSMGLLRSLLLKPCDFLGVIFSGLCVVLLDNKEVVGLFNSIIDEN